MSFNLCRVIVASTLLQVSENWSLTKSQGNNTEAAGIRFNREDTPFCPQYKRLFNARIVNFQHAERWKNMNYYWRNVHYHKEIWSRWLDHLYGTDDCLRSTKAFDLSEEAVEWLALDFKGCLPEAELVV